MLPTAKAQTRSRHTVSTVPDHSDVGDWKIVGQELCDCSVHIETFEGDYGGGEQDEPDRDENCSR